MQGGALTAVTSRLCSLVAGAPPLIGQGLYVLPFVPVSVMADESRTIARTLDRLIMAPLIASLLMRQVGILLIPRLRYRLACGWSKRYMQVRRILVSRYA